MSDNLRDRIAAVQRAHRMTYALAEPRIPRCACGWVSPEEHCTWTDHPEHVADAVIRELGLRRETRTLEDGYGGISTDYKTGITTRHFKPPTRQTRYVTDWFADDGPTT